MRSNKLKTNYGLLSELWAKTGSIAATHRLYNEVVPGLNEKTGENFSVLDYQIVRARIRELGEPKPETPKTTKVGKAPSRPAVAFESFLEEIYPEMESIAKKAFKAGYRLGKAGFEENVDAAAIKAAAARSDIAAASVFPPRIDTHGNDRELDHTHNPIEELLPNNIAMPTAAAVDAAIQEVQALIDMPLSPLPRFEVPAGVIH